MNAPIKYTGMKSLSFGALVPAYQSNENLGSAHWCIAIQPKNQARNYGKKTNLSARDR